jgi:hypothetical protein
MTLEDEGSMFVRNVGIKSKKGNLNYTAARTSEYAHGIHAGHFDPAVSSSGV